MFVFFFLHYNYELSTWDNQDVCAYYREGSVEGMLKSKMECMQDYNKAVIFLKLSVSGTHCFMTTKILEEILYCTQQCVSLLSQEAQ